MTFALYLKFALGFLAVVLFAVGYALSMYDKNRRGLVYESEDAGTAAINVALLAFLAHAFYAVKADPFATSMFAAWAVLALITFCFTLAYKSREWPDAREILWVTAVGIAVFQTALPGMRAVALVFAAVSAAKATLDLPLERAQDNVLRSSPQPWFLCMWACVLTALNACIGGFSMPGFFIALYLVFRFGQLGFHTHDALSKNGEFIVV